MRSNKTESVSQTPDTQMTIEDYFGKNYEYDKVKDNPIYKAFNEKSKQINDICRNVCLDIGEAQMMYGKSWQRLKYYEFDRVKEWVRNNYRRNYQILCPERHEAMMSMRTEGCIKYQNWFLRGQE